MKFTVTPLGGGRRDIARVVDGIVRYLQPPPTTGPLHPVRPTLEASAPSQYYADAGEEPGRWLGRAAERAGLTGTVDREDFASVLSGRDPRTGERLITAQGSAGRRERLGAGNATRVRADGELLFDVADAAAVLGVSKSEVVAMLDAGASLDAPSGEHDPEHDRVVDRVSAFPQFRGAYLTPTAEPDGSRWVTGTDLADCVAARQEGADPDQVGGLGDREDRLTLAEAARLAGTTARYLRRLAQHHHDHREEIALAVAAGRATRRAWLIADRDDRGRWSVTRQHLVEFMERRRPPAVRVGFDLTLTTEKSLGVLALVGDDETSRTVLGAIQDANDWAMRWLEDRAAYGRIDNKPVKAIGWMTATFRHLTSRALDPFPHHHNVIANTVTLSDGSHRGLDARRLYRHARVASALATAEMRHQLSMSLGVRWRAGRKSGWEIDGIDDQVVAEFSQRRNEIDDALAELEEEIGRGAHPGEVEHIVLATRPAKNHTPAQDLIDQWRTRAAALGLDTTSLTRLAAHTLMAETPAPEVVFDALAGPDGICAEGSVFTRADAIVQLANQPMPMQRGGPQPLTVGAARLQELTDEFLASDRVVQLLGTDEPRFTTVEMLSVQQRIVERYRNGLATNSAAVGDDDLADALDAHKHLTGEQRHLVESWCRSGHRIQTAIGRAGAGKTTTVAACANAWIAAGYRVVGAAVKGEAARTLAAATGIDCETVAWYLTHDDPDRAPIDARTILIVDEASTLADRDLDALLAMAERTGAAVRLIGDPAQHGAIAAGGMFRVLCQHHPDHTPELVTTHRLQDPHDRAAAEALRDGRIDDALDHLTAAGHLHVVDDDLTMYRHVLARWWDAHQAGHDHPMVDRRNSTRRQLNRLAHLLRRANGELGADELLASGHRCFAIGDRVTARAPDRDLHVTGRSAAYVRNGALGTITGIRHGVTPSDDTLVVAFDGIGTIDVPRAFFDHHPRGPGTEVGIDHAYALTSYAVQGSTHDLSTSRVDATATRAETYVDITRGRHSNHLYLTATTTSLDGEALPRLPASPVEYAVTDRLEHSGEELTAWELAVSTKGRHLESDRPTRVSGRRVGTLRPIVSQTRSLGSGGANVVGFRA